MATQVQPRASSVSIGRAAAWNGWGRIRSSSTLKFLLVGGSGLVVNQVLLVALTELVGLHYVVSAIVATIGSSTWNYVLADRWAFAGRRAAMGGVARFLSFLAINYAFLLVRGPILVGLTEVVRMNYAWSNLTSLIALTMLRLAFADRFVWRNAAAAAPAADTSATDPAATPAAAGASFATADTTAARSPRYRYDVAGIISIHSDVVLRELAYFRTETQAVKADIRIRIGLVAPRPSTRIRFEERGAELIYKEHLGPIAANFSLRMGDPIEITVSPVLALSPHVLYTNIVEAFLRFLFVSKGYVLLHSAALADDSGVTLMSAQTDTGKTSTVITLVRQRGYRFLSDDMTIIDAAAGEAISYPKPMTLSFHTMGVAKDGRLTAGDRAKLAIQSRLHSKSGREVGRTLGQRNIPIMTVNSAVQALVPPPKHRIEALFDCEVGGRAPIRNVVLMERGSELLDTVALDEAVRRLIDNTDDAYGFPPFATFAPRIRIGDDDYPALRRKETALLTQALLRAHLWQIRTPGHGWADILPELIDGHCLVPVGPGRPERDVEPVAVGPGRPGTVAMPAPVGPGARSEPAPFPFGVAGGSAFSPTGSGFALEPAPVFSMAFHGPDPDVSALGQGPG